MLTAAVKCTLRAALDGGVVAAAPLVIHDLTNNSVPNWWHLAAVFGGAALTVVLKALNTGADADDA